MKGRRILLIDDCEEIGKYICESLASAYEVFQAFSCQESDDALTKEIFSLILIDVQLPDGNGFDYCQKLVKDLKFKHIPKILVTAEADVSSRVYGLTCGADDYIVKPFVGPELKARIDARLRYTSKSQESIFEIEGFRLDSKNMTCTDTWNEDYNFHLTPTEFSIFFALAVNAGKVLSRADLVRSIWNESNINIASRGLDSHISRIRKKLLNDRLSICTIYTCGYCLEITKTKKRVA